MSLSRVRLPAVALLCCLLMLAGCAKKLPPTEPLGPAEREQAMALFADFLARRPPAILDADIRLTWDLLATKGGLDATIQLEQPGRLRFAANDPFGRSLLLVVANGATFTMIDNRAATVYVGQTGSKFWHEWIPEAIETGDLLFFLAGAVPADTIGGLQPAGDGEQAGLWFVWTDARTRRHYVLLRRETGFMLRHLLVDQAGTQVLDLRYQEPGRGDIGFAWPGQVTIQGEALEGAAVLRLDRIYPRDSLPAATFQVTPPPHFTVEEVD